MQTIRVYLAVLIMAGAMGTRPAGGMVMGTQDLLNGVGSVDTTEQQSAWTLGVYGSGAADFSTGYWYDSPYGIRLLSTWNTPTKGQFSDATTNVSTVAARVHSVEFYARKVNNNATTLTGNFMGTTVQVSGSTLSSTAWADEVLTYPAAAGSGVGTYTLRIRDTASTANANGVAVDMIRLYREVATPQVTSQSQTDLASGTSADITLGNGGGSLNDYLVAFDPDATVSWASGVPATVNSCSWTSDNQLSVNVTAGATEGVATLCVTNPYGEQTAEFTLTVVSAPKTTILGHVALQGYCGDYAAVAVRFDLTNCDGGDNLTRTVLLNPDGSFSLPDVPEGIYDIAVRSGNALGAVLEGKDVKENSADLGTIELTPGDLDGNNRIGFEDFSILQNGYGRRGGAAAAVTPPVPHAVDGTLEAGEWADLHSDPVSDKPANGCVELVRWGAEIRDGTLYAAFELDPSHTITEYNDPDNGKNIWLSLWLDVDPTSDPMTGVPVGDSQFSPRAQDIYIELGTDEGTLEGWHSLNLWGHGNDFTYKVPVEGTFAYSDHVVEFSCPVSAILAELPNTDGAVPASAWTVAARAAGYGFEGGYAGDITDLKPLLTSGVWGRVAIPGYQGDNATLGVNVTFTPAGGGAAISKTALINAEGSFVVDAVPAGTYNVTVKSGPSLSAVVSGVNISTDPVDLGTIELINGDINGDDQVSFEDFSVLQNNYGEAGTGGTASPLGAAAVGGCGGLGIAVLSFLGLASYAVRPRNE